MNRLRAVAVRGVAHLEKVMQLALVNGERQQAQRGLQGVCPSCGEPVIPKCGTVKVEHWAHKGKLTCDPWHEPETPWHRAWKRNFPIENQEVIAHDESGERHIADVKTAHGLVLEFQHSRLDPQERSAREAFYGNMVWVVDGTRLKRDWPRFHEARKEGYFRPTGLPGVYMVSFPDWCFPYDWLTSRVPVFFDFAGDGAAGPEPAREPLWCYLPGTVDNYPVVLAVSRQSFLEAANSRPQIIDVMGQLTAVANELNRQREEQRREADAYAKRVRQYRWAQRQTRRGRRW